MRRRRGAFDELVARQLELFADDEAALLEEAAEAEEAWIRAGRDEAEESYGDFQLVVDAIADRLLEIREATPHARRGGGGGVPPRVPRGRCQAVPPLRVARRRPRALIVVEAAARPIAVAGATGRA